LVDRLHELVVNSGVSAGALVIVDNCRSFAMARPSMRMSNLLCRAGRRFDNHGSANQRGGKYHCRNFHYRRLAIVIAIVT